jgi:hypothetical protein
MTAGRNKLRGHESLYDLCPVVLTDSFSWEQRHDVFQSLSKILTVRAPLWTFGGAYIFLTSEREGQGNTLYIGETIQFRTRIENHLLGPPRFGNAHKFLCDHFSVETRQCVLALLVVGPDLLPVFDSPDDGAVWEVGVAKRAGEALEALLLKAHLNWKGALPPRNVKRDEAKAHHDHDAATFVTLIRHLLKSDDGWADFETFSIRQQRQEAEERLARHVDQCVVLNGGGA